jgi:tripartite-type tricarboxylate transporter receptor subunit TctC
VKSGKVRVLAHSGSARIAGAPEVPTFKELGYAALEAPIWFGIVGPGGMRPELAGRLNETFVQAMRTPALRERMARLDLEIREMSAAEFAAMLKADYERWGRIVKASGWKPE